MSINLGTPTRKNSALTGSASNARTLSPHHHIPPVWRRLPGRLGRGAELLTLFTYACLAKIAWQIREEAELLTLFTYACVAKIAWQIGEGGGASHSLYLRMCGKDCLADWGGGGASHSLYLRLCGKDCLADWGGGRSFSLSLLTPVWQRLPGRLGRGAELLTLFTYACVAKIAWQIGEGGGASHSLLMPVWQRLPGRLGRGAELLTLFTYACVAKIAWQIGEGGEASHSLYLRLCGKDCLADWGGGRSFSLSLLTPVWQRLPGRLGRGAELLTLFTYACVAKIAWQIGEGGGASHFLYLRLCGKDCLADWGGGRSFSLSLLTPVWQRLPGRLGRGAELLNLFTNEVRKLGDLLSLPININVDTSEEAECTLYTWAGATCLICVCVCHGHFFCPPPPIPKPFLRPRNISA